MSFLNKFFRNRGPVSVILAVIISVFFVVAIVEAATTISENINTAGTLIVGVDGTGTDVTFYTDTAGEEFLWDASANQLTLDGEDGTTVLAVTDGNVVITDNLTVSAGTLVVGVDGTGTDVTFYTDTASEEFLWDASANQLALDGADGTTVLAVTDGNVVITDNLTVSGTTVLGGGSTITGLVFGACNIADTPITASTTAYADCTSATGIVLGTLVFVTATSSLPGDFIIQAASSTATDIINLRIYNSNTTGQTTTGVRSLNFIGIR